MITFLAIYGGMHLYILIKLCNLFQPKIYQKWLLVTWLIVMTIAPLIVRVAEQFGMDKTALAVAWPGYLWMGFLFIFTSLLLLADTVLYFYRFIILRFSKWSFEFISSLNAFKFALIIAAFASVYAFIEANQIRSEHVLITSPKISPSISRIRIVQVSDVHIGLLLQKYRQERILAKIREAAPDILVSTGDLIDGKLNLDYSISERTPLASLLTTVSAPYGKFAVIGNHEVYAGLPQAIAFTRAAGFKILRNQSIGLKNGITISGVDDLTASPNAAAAQGSEINLINTVSSESFHLLLKHRPDILPESDGRFDLQLSGHVHNGQIFPFNFLVRLKHHIPCGATVTAAGSHIYVSRGTGTWGPPMRLFAPPEVTVIDIIPQL